MPKIEEGFSDWFTFWDYVNSNPSKKLSAEDILKLAEEHYWDTLEPQKEIVLQHLRAILDMMK